MLAMLAALTALASIGAIAAAKIVAARTVLAIGDMCSSWLLRLTRQALRG
jgi:hypothetical protein